MMLGIIKFKFRNGYFCAWIESWIYLASDLVGIFSLGYLTTNWPDIWYEYIYKEK